jgi:glucosamine kinase
MPVILIADSGATKCQWALVKDGKSTAITTQGISPYFLTGEQITALLSKELIPKLKKGPITHIHFYGTGLANPDNAAIVKKVLKAFSQGKNRSEDRYPGRCKGFMRQEERGCL